MEKFTFFWDGIYSNWYQSKFIVDGIEYLCVEQYMMSQKALLFNDIDSLNKIMNESSPRIQKALGRKVIGFDKVKWETVAKDIVYKGCYAKFTQNNILKQELLKTAGTTLVEASPYDTIWGIGLKETDKRAKNRNTWNGSNWLGEVLTKVRQDIANDYIKNLIKKVKDE